MSHTPTILLVGSGKMGGAILEGWCAEGVSPSSITVIEKDASLAGRLAEMHGVHTITSIEKWVHIPDVIMLAVKPQILGDILPQYKKYAEKSLFISIAAGKTIGFFERQLGAKAAIIRSMPNLPATIRKGVSCAVANAYVTASQKALATKLLQAIGALHWLEDEALMDAVTALSGSGPAYIFHLLEALEQAGIVAGLPAALAKDLAYKTLQGSTELAVTSSYNATQLREQVTSPGGTTAAALGVLMDNKAGLVSLCIKAVTAARDRSIELAE